MWTFLWFICFCVLANQWSKTTDSNAGDAARAVVAFSFFSIVTWVSLLSPSLVTSIWLTKSHDNLQLAQNLLKSCIKAPLTDSDFSQQALLSYFAYARYRQGVSEFDQEYRDPANDHTTPYPPAQYPSSSGPTGYQQSPFPSRQEDPGNYQPPAYWRTENQTRESKRGVFFLRCVPMVSFTSRTVPCTPIFLLQNMFVYLWIHWCF